MKNLCDFLTVNETSSPDTGRITSAISVISGEMLSIIISTPISVAVDVIICVILWLSP